MGQSMCRRKLERMSDKLCDILLANLQVCGSVIGAMPLLTLQVAR